MCKGFILGNNELSQEEDFARLPKWIRSQERFQEFLTSFDEASFADPGKGTASREEFADRLYLVLKD